MQLRRPDLFVPRQQMTFVVTIYSASLSVGDLNVLNAGADHFHGFRYRLDGASAGHGRIAEIVSRNRVSHRQTSPGGPIMPQVGHYPGALLTFRARNLPT
jgi:hypothetical protein